MNECTAAFLSETTVNHLLVDYLSEAFFWGRGGMGLCKQCSKAAHLFLTWSKVFAACQVYILETYLVRSVLQPNMLLPSFSILSRDALHTLQMHTVCSPWRRPERGPGEHRAAQHLFVKAAWRIIMAYTPFGSPPPPLFSNGRSLM